MNYFKDKHAEFCAEKKAFDAIMTFNKVNEMIVYKAKRVTNSGFFYCKAFNEVGESGEGCGKQCTEYKPNNGKNGRCKHYGYCYENTGITVRLKLNKIFSGGKH